jgi:sRNA-binding protein
MLHQRALPRYELEDLVSELSFSYPKCFFTDQFNKRPLKKNIMLDLENDSMRQDDGKLNAALTFYTRDWNYESKLQAGAKRIDLDGNEVGTVTETEACEARERVKAAREERAAREVASKHEGKNVTVVTLPQRVVTPAPTIPEPMATIPEPMATIPEPMATIPEPMATMPEPLATIPEPIARVCKLVENIKRISTSTDDTVLRDALIVAAL